MEVVIAGFVAIIGLAGAMSIGIWQFQSTRFNQQASEAIAAGQDKLEELNYTPFETLGNGQDTKGPYILNWSVITSNRCKLVALDVSWHTPRTTHSIRLRDMYPDPETSGFVITP